MRHSSASLLGSLVTALVVGAPMLACEAEPPAESEAGAGAEEAEGEAGGEESETGDEPAPGDQCETTELSVSAPLELRGSLQRATASAVPGACEIDGPVVFYRLELPARVDLSANVRGREAEPKLALMRPGCVPAELDPSRVLACASELPTTLLDVGPSLSLILAVGLAADDPALLAPEFDAEAGELDPLEFLLELEVRAVLEEGERCDRLSSRCEAGTLCLDDEQGGPPRCTRPPADSCVQPGSTSLELDVPALLEISPDEAHSDAHEHTCTGWRRPERVERLELPSELPANAQLRVEADDGRVGLALRAPSCAPEDALACAPALGEQPTVLQWEGPALTQLAAAGEGPLLFIELPRADTAEAPLETVGISLELRSTP